MNTSPYGTIWQREDDGGSELHVDMFPIQATERIGARHGVEIRLEMIGNGYRVKWASSDADYYWLRKIAIKIARQMAKVYIAGCR
ncbi:MAG TPA: hypothetical protein VLH56_19155 [Dissulfurispiraceae bacterium]|nr:hypothetical protein [Dissulfurispiraceae bacterium]